MPIGFRYSRWDGSQAGFELDADDVPSSAYVDVLAKLPQLRGAVVDLAGSETPAAVASAVEFVLEGLHLSKRLNKDAVGAKATYRGRN